MQTIIIQLIQVAMLYRLQVMYFQKYNVGFMSETSKSTLLTVIIWLALSGQDEPNSAL